MQSETRDLRILELIQDDPAVNQKVLATELGLAVGTINWHLKRMVRKGYVKAIQMERRNLKYLLTPSGLQLKAKLTQGYIRTSMQLVDMVSEKMTIICQRLQAEGITDVRIQSDSDLQKIVELVLTANNIAIVAESDHTVLLEAYDVQLIMA